MLRTQDSCRLHQVFEVQEIFQELTETEGVSIATVEKRVLAAVGSWGQRLSEAILSETAGSTRGSPVSLPCPSCQGHSHRHRRRARNFTTVCGVLRLPRWEYKCKCGSIHVPWETRQELKGQYTQQVSATMKKTFDSVRLISTATNEKAQRRPLEDEPKKEAQERINRANSSGFFTKSGVPIW